MAASTRPPAVPAAATPSPAGVIQVRRQQTSNSSRTPGSRSGSCVTPTTVLLLEHSYMQKIDEATAAASAREQETLPSSPWCPRQLLVTLSLNWGISFCTLQLKSQLFLHCHFNENHLYLLCLQSRQCSSYLTAQTLRKAATLHCHCLQISH